MSGTFLFGHGAGCASVDMDISMDNHRISVDGYGIMDMAVKFHTSSLLVYYRMRFADALCQSPNNSRVISEITEDTTIGMFYSCLISSSSSSSSTSSSPSS